MTSKSSSKSDTINSNSNKNSNNNSKESRKEINNLRRRQQRPKSALKTSTSTSTSTSASAVAALTAASSAAAIQQQERTQNRSSLSSPPIRISSQSTNKTTSTSTNTSTNTTSAIPTSKVSPSTSSAIGAEQDSWVMLSQSKSKPKSKSNLNLNSESNLKSKSKSKQIQKMNNMESNRNVNTSTNVGTSNTTSNTTKTKTKRRDGRASTPVSASVPTSTPTPTPMSTSISPQQNDQNDQHHQPSDLDTIHGLLSSIGKELNIQPNSTSASASASASSSAAFTSPPASSSTHVRSNVNANSNANANVTYASDKPTSMATKRRQKPIKSSTYNNSNNNNNNNNNGSNHNCDHNLHSSTPMSMSMSMSIPYNSILLLTTDTFSVTTSTNTNTSTSTNTNTSSNKHNLKNKGMEASLSGRKISLANEHLIVISASLSNQNNNINSTSDDNQNSASKNNNNNSNNDNNNDSNNDSNDNIQNQNHQFQHQHQHQYKKSAASYLKYNDKIVLFNTNNKALGVNKKDLIGFWRSVIGEAEQWTIVPLWKKKKNDDYDYDDDDDQNQDAYQDSYQDAYHNDNDDDNDDCQMVESGANILLKNELNGKFLSLCPSHDDGRWNQSCNQNPKLCLEGLVWNSNDDDIIVDNDIDNEHENGVNDDNDNNDEEEYDDINAASTLKSTSKSLMTMVKTVQYSKKQIFNLVRINTPPCPTWVHARPYLNANYLSYPDRNQVDKRNNLFGTTNQDDKIMRRTMISETTAYDNSSSSNTYANADSILWNLDVSIQDSILVEEVLDVLIGLEGSYIVVSHNNKNSESNGNINTNKGNGHNYHDGIQFVLRDRSKIDLNVRYIVEKILPTAAAFAELNSFISKRLIEYEYGTTSHALCGAMDKLVKEYMDFIESLHDQYRQQPSSSLSPSITLSALYGELQPSIRTMSILQRIVQEIKYSKGGALLNKIEDLLQMEYLGDERAKSIFCYLFEQSSIPYMEMLSGWVEDGSLHDPYGEFMIEEKRRDMTPLASAGVDALDEDSLSWKNWYIIREEHVLNVLKSNQSGLMSQDNSELAQKIMITGKYWNAIALCQHRDKRAVQLVSRSSNQGAQSVRTTAPALTYGMVSVEMGRYIDHEYSMASRTFFNIIMRDYQTRDILAFMKRYFLLDQGDFFVHFLDMAEDELLQEMDDVSRGRVQNWMALSIQMSGGAGSVEHGLIFDFVSSLKGEFATQSLINDLDELHALDGGIRSYEPKTPSRHVYGGADKGLTGVEAFMLDFRKMPFPLSLILSRSTIRNYQLMFRHLFFAKHVERRLVGTWLDHQMIKEYSSLRKDMGKTYCLRQRMLHFMQNFVYYMMFEVIEPNFLSMESQLLGRETKGNGKYSFANTKNDTSKQQTVDDVLRIHNDFVRRTLKECLLTNRDLIRTLTKLMTTCLLFSDQMKLFMEATKIDEEQNNIANEARQKRTRFMYETAGILNERKEKKIRQALSALSQQRKSRKQKQIDMLRRELKTESYQNMISRFEQVFNSNLSEFMTQLMADSEGRYHSHLSNLCVRLDYNGFVTRSMKKL